VFGKSVFSTILAKYAEKRKIKTLLADFDNWSSINTIFNINKYTGHETNISFNLDILDRTNIRNGETNQNADIYNLLNERRKEYELLIIDTALSEQNEQLKLLLEYSNKIVFLMEPNILEIKKANSILETYIKDWNINMDKIKIVFNKTNNNAIIEDILRQAFSEIEIVGSIPYNEKFNLYIDKKTNEKIKITDLEKIYNKIRS